MIDREKIERWKDSVAKAKSISEEAYLSCPEAYDLSTDAIEAVPALLNEVERLRAESIFARDPRGEPEVWVEIDVRASDPEQRRRTLEWIRNVEKILPLLREALPAIDTRVSASDLPNRIEAVLGLPLSRDA